MWYEINEKYSGIKREILRQYLSKCKACIVNEPLKRNDPIRNIVAKSVFERVQIDLVDLSKYESQNEGFKWILNIIDCYSKYLFSYKLKAKSGILVNLFLFRCRRNSEIYLRIMDHQELCKVTMERNLKISMFMRFVMNSESLESMVVQENRPLKVKLREPIRLFVDHWQKICMAKRRNGSIFTVLFYLYLDQVVRRYNNIRHRAINKRPFESFFRRKKQFNSEFDMEENAENDIIIDDNIDDNAAYMEGSLTCSEPELDDLEADQVEEINVDDGGDIEQVAFNERYLRKENSYKQVHLRKTQFFVGDKVLLAKDFDNNQDTKKLKLEPFKYEDEFIIVEILEENKLRLSQNGNEFIVDKSRVIKFG